MYRVVIVICTVEELCRKDVINVHNGKRIGMVCDCEVLSEEGKILAILVMPVQPLFTLRRPEPFRIDWKCITVIGDETILVACECDPERRNREKHSPFSSLFGR